MRTFRSLRSRGREVLQKTSSIKGTVEAIGGSRLEVLMVVIAEGLYTDVRLGHMNSEAAEAGFGVWVKQDRGHEGVPRLGSKNMHE